VIKKLIIEQGLAPVLIVDSMPINRAFSGKKAVDDQMLKTRLDVGYAANNRFVKPRDAMSVVCTSIDT